MNIIQRIVPESLTNVRPGFKMVPEYITIHNTANTSKGANAELHSRYLLNGAGGASKGWHYTVDEKDVYQHIPTDESAYHAGDGSGNGNRKSIGIEICENVDGEFEGAVQKAAELVGFLMKQHNIPSHKVVPHKHWSGKQCPRKLLDRWQQFINLCIAERGKLEQGKVKGVSTRELSVREQEIQAEAIRLGITDGKNPFREVNQMYVWACLIPLAKRIEELEKN